MPFAARPVWFAAAVAGSLALGACSGSKETAQSATAVKHMKPEALLAGTHTEGVYDVETTPDGTPFRWTNGRATVVGPADASPPVAMHLTVYAFTPTRATITLDKQIVYRGVLPPGATDVHPTLDGGSPTPTLRIVSDTFRPKVDSGSSRTLGVEIWDLSYARSFDGIDLVLDPASPAQLTGFYPLEKTPTGDPFRWTNGNASVRIPRGVRGPLVLRMRSFQATPVYLRLDGNDLGELNVSGDATKRIDLAGSRSHVLNIQSSAWYPPADNGLTRKLGVEVIGFSNATGPSGAATALPSAP